MKRRFDFFQAKVNRGFFVIPPLFIAAGFWVDTELGARLSGWPRWGTGVPRHPGLDTIIATMPSARRRTVGGAMAQAGQSELLACMECDLLVSVGELRGDVRALCPRCGFVLSARVDDGLNRAMAYGLAAAFLLIMANSFPFLALEAKGFEKVMTLPGAAVDLYRDGYWTIAVLVLGVIVVVPAIMIGLLGSLVVPLVRGRAAPWLVPAGRLLFSLRTWSMAEVFIIGVIVSLVKIGEMATVFIGLSFWTYVAFSLCFTAAMASLDKLEVWTEIERCRA